MSRDSLYCDKDTKEMDERTSKLRGIIADTVESLDIPKIELIYVLESIIHEILKES
jgi:hypothetical protein